ncbi:MAG: EamA family transporter [Verrucomicrobiia bacterium]|jgi:drug/metabolite transporter (DMT)-like permease
MTKLILILLVGLLCEALGVVLLSKGLKQIGGLESVSLADILRVLKAGATNPNLVIGVALETVFFGILLVLLSRADVSFVWPLTALGFALTTLSAKCFLHEEVSWVRWSGVLLIVAGASLITWSEKSKQTKDSNGIHESVDAKQEIVPR